jgi:nucleotide-binding universal stress UspA family protein
MFQAIQDFRNARRRAIIEQIVARLTGRSADLLAYDEVRTRLKVAATEPRVLKEIPLDAIVGSVGRYTDFTRSFLPRSEDDQTRWVRVRVKIDELAGLPPIDVYQIGQVYFVRDGNHRVSVARELGATHIEAYVSEVQTKVPLTPDVQPDDLIVKAEYADFLERTHLDRIRPEADLTMSIPGQYAELLEQIDVYRYFLGQNQQREIPYDEAVAGWYEEVYLPIVQPIRQRDLLAEFPGRTEADLYLWISRHRAALREALEWEVEPGDAAVDLAYQASPRIQRVASRLADRVLDALIPDELEAGPSPGNWRRVHLLAGRQDRLFTDILVPVSGHELGWRALHQAVEVARREGGRLFGLYVVPGERQRDGARAGAIQVEFERRCAEAGIPGQLAIATGKVARTICERARWTHLISVSLAHPPQPQPGAKLQSGFRTLIRRCSPPMLAVPGAVSPLDRALLAYDGSPKAQEALFVATYLAGQWRIPLVVVSTAEEESATSARLSEAGDYLRGHGVQATFVARSGPPAAAILHTAEEHHCDLILLGGYGRQPLAEVILGSTVDELLRTSPWPLLICR